MACHAPLSPKAVLLAIDERGLEGFKGSFEFSPEHEFVMHIGDKKDLLLLRWPFNAPITSTRVCMVS